MSLPVYPGGYTLGWLLFFNLVAAHARRLVVSWQKGGLILVHLGLLVLLLGEFFTSLWQVEYRMRIDEGQTSQYAEAPREVELALIDTSHPEHDLVISIPQSRLKDGERIAIPSTDIELHIIKHFENTDLKLRSEAPHAPASLATTGIGPQVAVFPRPRTTVLDERDIPSTYVEVIHASKSIGVWLVSNGLAVEQSFEVEERPYLIALRQKRQYFHFTLTLLKFTHERYPGTEIPKDFSSLLTLSSHDSPPRQVKVFMNHPLRFSGYTFYQSGFDNDDTTTILQVVRNPSWLFPYIACIMVTIGLLWQFSTSLARSRPPKSTASSTPAHGDLQLPASPLWQRHLPSILFAIATLYVGTIAIKAILADAPLDRLGRVPVLLNGRLKPLDTVARSTLLSLSGREFVATETGKQKPMEWLSELLYTPEIAATRDVFQIHNPGVLGLLNLNTEQKRFSFATLQPHLPSIEKEAINASDTPSAARDPYQKAIVKLYQQIRIYHSLVHTQINLTDKNNLLSLNDFEELLPKGVAAYRDREQGIPHDEASLNRLRIYAQSFFDANSRSAFSSVAPQREHSDAPDDWQSLGEALMLSIKAGSLPDSARIQWKIAEAYRSGDFERLAELSREHETHIAALHPLTARRAKVESRFNAINPFGLAMSLYVVVFLLVCAAWSLQRDTISVAASRILWLCLLIHTAGLLTRMWLENRPPVTNLYSSAVFVGWGAALLGAIIEKRYRNGFGAATAAIMGFTTLIIAHHLSLTGDTLEMMRAVLDSNFWLATHVIVITLGYSATFLAGTIALMMVGRALLNRGIPIGEAKLLTQLIYGVICFALLFSFVGTVLGGIWADQSWGRFWGWDPKENGALLIVFWNALILHARWGGIIKERGIAALAIIGNIVTSWSWFGTNMLGIGLHSYGFMDSAFLWLIAFVASMLVFAFAAFTIKTRRPEKAEYLLAT